jgi:hypothetical protein
MIKKVIQGGSSGRMVEESETWWKNKKQDGRIGIMVEHRRHGRKFESMVIESEALMRSERIRDTLKNHRHVGRIKGTLK